MDKAVTCEHLNKLAEDLGRELWQSKENLSCIDCGCPGPNLWICLQPNCQHVGCSEVKNDHSTIHQKNYPSHCVHMNISTERIWCYLCEKEVYLKAALAYVNSPPDSTTLDEVTIGNRLGSGLISPDDEPDPDEMDYDDPRPRGLVGLQNMGNTCYMNAALQALSNTQPLTMYFLECAAAVAAVTNDSKPGVSRAYQKLIKEMWSRRTRGYVVPNGILYGIRNVHPMFRGYHQHDTQEFLRCFMDQLHEELKEPVWDPCPEDRLTSEADGDHDSRNVIIRRRAASHGASDAQFFGRMRRKSPAPSSYNDPYFRVPDSVPRHRRSASFAGTQQFAYNVHHVTHRINDPPPPARSDPGSESELSCSSELEDRYETCSSGNSDTDVHKPKQSYGAGDASPAVRYRSIVSDVFDGKLLSSVQCLICNRVSTRVETFQDLSLPIPSREHLAVIRCQQPVVSHGALASQDSWVWWVVGWLRSWFYGPVVSLQDCLAAFFSADELKGDNMYSCSRCNKLRNGIKMSGVVRLPEVLCVHLKRFRHELMFSAKVAARVTFPIHNLDMQPYTHKDCTSKLTRYELCAVISHAGTAGGGHYTCVANNNRRWYTFDDQTVTPLSQHHVANLEAYVLFYRKVNPQMDVLRQKAAEILESAELDADETKYYISKQWINKFNSWAEPGPIDNSDFVCSHAGVRPERAPRLTSLAATVPASLWHFLTHRFGGGPAVTVGVACATCARAAAGLRARTQREMMLFSRLHAALQDQDPPHTIYAISMNWFRQWQSFVRNKTPQPPPPVDNTNILTKQDIDGKTTYTLKPGSDHAQLNEELWRFFIDIYGGGPEVKTRTQHNTTQTIVNDTKERRNSRMFDREDPKSNSDVNIRDTVNEQRSQSLQNVKSRQVSTSKTESDDDVHYTFHYKHEPNGNFQDSDEEMDTPVNTIRMENGVDSDHDSNDNPVKAIDKETELPNLDSISLKGKAKKARRSKRRAVK